MCFVRIDMHIKLASNLCGTAANAEHNVGRVQVHAGHFSADANEATLCVQPARPLACIPGVCMNVNVNVNHFRIHPACKFNSSLVHTHISQITSRNISGTLFLCVSGHLPLPARRAARRPADGRLEAHPALDARGLPRLLRPPRRSGRSRSSLRLRSGSAPLLLDQLDQMNHICTVL